jgi:hypothetical protein
MRVRGLESLEPDHTAAAGSKRYGKKKTFKVNKPRRLSVNFYPVELSSKLYNFL